MTSHYFEPKFAPSLQTLANNLSALNYSTLFALYWSSNMGSNLVTRLSPIDLKWAKIANFG